MQGKKPDRPRLVPALFTAGRLAWTSVAAARTAAAAAAAAAADEPPDLRTRISGSDWPRFLGPTGDGKSSQRIRTDRPLAIRWHRDAHPG